jgi:RNA polymerase sigma-70 factor (ECF subfamily)
MDSSKILDPDTWVEEHGDALYRYAFFRIHSTQVAEDLVQETFLAALKARDSFAGRSSERTWLFGILKHKIIDHIRKASRERSEDIDLNLAASGESFDDKGGWKSGPAKWITDPGLLYQQQEFWEMLNRCLAELPPRLHQAFTLRELDGQSMEEICKILQVSSTNGGVMLHRARVRLRECLEQNWFDKEEGEES